MYIYADDGLGNAEICLKINRQRSTLKVVILILKLQNLLIYDSQEQNMNILSLKSVRDITSSVLIKCNFSGSDSC